MNINFYELGPLPVEVHNGSAFTVPPQVGTNRPADDCRCRTERAYTCPVCDMPDERDDAREWCVCEPCREITDWCDRSAFAAAVVALTDERTRLQAKLTVAAAQLRILAYDSSDTLRPDRVDPAAVRDIADDLDPPA